MKIEELELKDWRIRRKLIGDLYDKALSMVQNPETDYYDYGVYNIFAWSLDAVAKLMDAEKHLIDLSTEIPDAKSAFLIQKHLHDFVEDTLYQCMKYLRDVMGKQSYDYCNYDTENFGRKVMRTLNVLLETYEEIYL